MPGYQNGTQHELWLAQPNGTRLAVMDLAGDFTYTRALNGAGFFSIALPFEFDQTLLKPDNRVYIWRKPVGGAMAIAFAGLLRRIVTSTDAAAKTSRLIQGPGMNYLLAGRVAAYVEGNTNVDTTVTPVAADDLLKAIVRTNLGSTATVANGRKASGVIDASYFGVAANLTLAPTLALAFSYRNVLDICKEICDASRTAGTELYFDIVPAIEDGDTHTVEFRTYIGQPGKDRTADGDSPMTFGLEFENLAEPELIEDGTDEVNRAYGLGQGQEAERIIEYADDVTRQAASLWALREGTAQALVDTSAGVQDVADAALAAGRPQTTFTAKLRSVTGYTMGVDWDWGDRVQGSYDGRDFEALVRAVTVSVNGDGYESIDAAIEGYLL